MREHTEQPESIYILQLQHGDKKSFETLFNQYYIPLVDYAYRLLHDRDAAKDIIQDIFFQLWDKHSDLNIKTSLHSYLYKMVYTKCISSIRHQAVIQKYIEHSMLDIYFQELIQTPESELELINKDINHFINEAIDQLPPRCKEIFILSRIEHKSHQEIARQLNLSTKTIESQLTIALARLRKELEWLLVAILFFKHF